MKTTSEIKKESREESKKEPKEYSFHAAVLTSGDEIYLLDPAMPKVGIVKLKEMNEKSLNNVYSGKEILGGKKIVGVNSFNIKEGRHEILSTYYEEGADYYHNRNKPFFAMKYYKKALKLNSNNKTLKEKAAINYVYTAVNNITDKKKQEELFRKAIELYPEYAEANFRLGTLLSSQKRYKEAIVFFEKAITLLEKVTEPKPWHLMARSNLAICFYSLKKYREAKERYLEIIKLTNKKLKANPRNIMLLEHSCKANLNLVAIYYNKEKNSEKAKYHNSKAFQYAERGIKLSREGSKEHKLFLKIKEKTQLNFKLFH